MLKIFMNVLISQGFGQVTLTSILPLDAASDSDIDQKFDLFVYDFSLSSKQVYVMTVVVTRVGYLKVTLVGLHNMLFWDTTHIKTRMHVLLLP